MQIPHLIFLNYLIETNLLNRPTTKPITIKAIPSCNIGVETNSAAIAATEVITQVKTEPIAIIKVANVPSIKIISLHNILYKHKM